MVKEEAVRELDMEDTPGIVGPSLFLAQCGAGVP